MFYFLISFVLFLMRLTPVMSIFYHSAQTFAGCRVGYGAVCTQNQVLRSLREYFVNLTIKLFECAVDEHAAMVETTQDGALEHFLSMAQLLYIKLWQIDDGAGIVGPCVEILIVSAADVQDVQRCYRVGYFRDIFIPLAQVFGPYFRLLSEEFNVTAVR